jgi:hypothetical protein
MDGKYEEFAAANGFKEEEKLKIEWICFVETDLTFH